MKIIITKHGLTEENIKGIVQGHLPGTLSKEGKEQACKLALRLKDEKIDKIFSSDLARAVDTAKEIAKYHKDTPLIFTEEIREIDYGINNGKRSSEIDRSVPHDGETFEELRLRAKKFLDKLSGDKTYLVVSHNTISSALLAVIKNKKLDSWEKVLDATGVTLVEDGKIIFENDLSHLNADC